ncbi:MAG: YbdK family carboxylate-amine ligase [Mariprofundus sp.]
MNQPQTPPINFNNSKLGSLGVELEWITVDADSGKQIPAAPALLAKIGETPRIKAELFTSTIEINSDIHTQTMTCMAEMQALYRQVNDRLQGRNTALLSSGTHPFSRWRNQTVSSDPRYHKLVKRLQWMARRFNIFGVHVHVGMPDPETCIKAMNRLIPVMPAFLAISANSPFWTGHDTGLSACRIKIFEGLSQGGMPFCFEDWRDFEHCAGRLVATESIDSVREIWWEMRPHPDFGTLEIRIGDMPATFADTAAYVAYVRAEAMAAANHKSTAQVHPIMVRENRWRACRYGIRAEIIDPDSEKIIPVLDWIEARLEDLQINGADGHDIALIRSRLPHWRQQGDGATRQRNIHAQHPQEKDMIRELRNDGWQHGEY